MEEGVIEFDLLNRSGVTVTLESTIALVFTFLSLFGNALIIAAFFSLKALRTIPNLLVVNLSIVDILAALTTHPLLASVLIQGAWRLGKEACEYQAIMNSFLFTTSHLSITLLSLNRYLIIVRYKKYTNIFTKRSTRIVLVAIWIFSSLMGLSHLMAREQVTFHPEEAICVIKSRKDSATSFVMTIFGNVVFLATVYFNFAIFRLVRLHRRQVAASFSKNIFPSRSSQVQTSAWRPRGNAVVKRRRTALRSEDFYIARKVLIVTSFYTLCWLPQGILKNASLANVDFSRTIWMMSTFCMQLSSVLNPVLYGLLNRKLRKTIFGMLGIKTKNLIRQIAATEAATTKRLNLNTLKHSFIVTHACN